jgi:hypothetical protein
MTEEKAISEMVEMVEVIEAGEAVIEAAIEAEAAIKAARGHAPADKAAIKAEAAIEAETAIETAHAHHVAAAKTARKVAATKTTATKTTAREEPSGLSVLMSSRGLTAPGQASVRAFAALRDISKWPTIDVARETRSRAVSDADAALATEQGPAA